MKAFSATESIKNCVATTSSESTNVRFPIVERVVGQKEQFCRKYFIILSECFIYLSFVSRNHPYDLFWRKFNRSTVVQVIDCLMLFSYGSKCLITLTICILLSIGLLVYLFGNGNLPSGSLTKTQEIIPVWLRVAGAQVTLTPIFRGLLPSAVQTPTPLPTPTCKSAATPTLRPHPAKSPKPTSTLAPASSPVPTPTPTSSPCPTSTPTATPKARAMFLRSRAR